jgi:transposase
MFHERHRPVCRWRDSDLPVNLLFRAANRNALGYAHFETMPTVLFLIAGELDYARFNEHAR